MGEYIRYRGRQVKIGTCELMYYVTYPRYIGALSQGLLSPCDCLFPACYAQPGNGFIFRFPFPDEDAFSFGDIEGNSFRRSVELAVPYHQQLATALGMQPNGGKDQRRSEIRVGIYGQKLIDKGAGQLPALVTVVLNHHDGNLYRLEDPKIIACLLNAISLQFLQQDHPAPVRDFWAKMAQRMAGGYLAADPGNPASSQ